MKYVPRRNAFNPFTSGGMTDVTLKIEDALESMLVGEISEVADYKMPEVRVGKFKAAYQLQL